MRKLFSFLAFALLVAGVSAQQDTLKYRISLKDKAATEYSLKQPEKFLSEKRLNVARSRIFPLILQISRFATNI